MVVPKKKIGIFSLAMMNVAVIASLRILPLMAKEGISLVFFFLLAGILFLVPSSLVSAELATGWPKRGGVYIWVKEGLGTPWGFVAIWLEWIQNVFWFPIALSFGGSCLAYLWNPDLAHSRIYMIALILIVYWGSTFINLFGIKFSSIISSTGVVVGTLFPTLFLIVLGIIWLFTKQTLQVNLSPSTIFPRISDIYNWVFLAGLLLTFGGMEVSAVHVKAVKNPTRTYPWAILIALIVVFSVFMFGSLALAFVIPHKEISLVAGVMQAFTEFLNAFNIGWLIPVMAGFVFIGTLAEILTWIVGPSRGLYVASLYGQLPPFFQTLNKHKVTAHLLWVQGAIVTAVSFVFLLIPSVEGSYWILTALTAQLYLLMYVLMYIAAIRLRYTQPNVKRAYKIPFGNFGMWVVAGGGIIGAVLAILLGFLPPRHIQTGSVFFFDAFLVCGLIITCVCPLIINHFKKNSWKAKKSLLE